MRLMHPPKNLPLLVKAGLALLWLALLLLVLRRDFFVAEMNMKEAELLQKGREESYQSISFAGDRIGYVRSRLTPQAGEVRLEQESVLRLNILGEQHPVTMSLSAHLSEGFVLKNFSFSFSSPLYKMRASGEVEGLLLSFTLDTGKTEIRDQLKLNAPPIFPTVQRGFLLQQDLVSGRKLKITFFDPFSLTSHERIIEYRGQEKILIEGRVQLLHHFSETFAGIRINSWLDDQGKVIKEESPAGFVLLAEPEFKARSITAAGRELLGAVAVKAGGRMPDPEGLIAMTYRITVPAETAIDLHQGRQSGEGSTVRVVREELPPDNALPCAGQEKWLASSPYIRADAPQIKELGAELSQGAATALEKTRRLAAWIYGHLDKRPVIGIPDALTTLQQKKGDCNEHAALFTALARSVGIPTRIAAGVTYHNNAFYYHAWNEVCIGDGWLSLDTTKNQLPADVSHLKFTDGETTEMLRIGALLGNLAIDALPGGEDHDRR